VALSFSDEIIIAVNVVAWFAWSVGVGYVGHRLPIERFTVDSWLTKLRRFERDGRWYERRLRIKRWKDRLPEAGAFFGGGFSKRSVRRVDLDRYLVETRRAETVHWAAMSLTPVFAIWNPPWAMVAIVVYALAANGPCLLVQRYNRARLVRILEIPEPLRSR
jgi:glycosyl-4,4'-diaponeurosporenoate acyltransferase